MAILDDRQEQIERQNVDVYICGFCGKEITHDDIAATFDGQIYDWPLKDTANTRFNVCKKCYDTFMGNISRQEAIDFPEGGC